MSATATARPRVLSGIQPDFGLHLGNYLGALRNWARDQDRYENYFCIVDLHALTRHPDPERLRALTLELAGMYIACGLDPARCEIFVQSHVTAHSQMCWILETITPMGWLERMTQFKAQSEAQGVERVNAGVFTYPVLMAADILLYDADFVPVGEDQRQHIELTRDLAQRLNSQRGDVVRVPAPLISTVGARVMGLDTPDEKMSKSIAVDHPGHAVLLLDPPDVIRRKIARATTDTESRGAQAGRCRGREPARHLRRAARDQSGRRARGVRRQAIQRAQGSGRRCGHRRAEPHSGPLRGRSRR